MVVKVLVKVVTEGLGEVVALVLVKVVIEGLFKAVINMLVKVVIKGLGEVVVMGLGKVVVKGLGKGNDDDDDDESTFHGAHTRRGHASQVQVLEPINREWIWIEDGDNQEKSTRIIGVILKAMWNGPWDSWRDVPNEDRTRLFERFHGYLQWEEKWNVPICRHWEKCIAGKFPDFLRRVRNEAKETTRKQGLLVGDDMLVLIDYKPP
ncbi:hypothetical protein R6Q59_007461 [Mikania micrantha]